MGENNFEGSSILEQLAALGKLDDFWEAVDLDDVKRAVSLMKLAKINDATIRKVVKKMQDSSEPH